MAIPTNITLHKMRRQIFRKPRKVAVSPATGSLVGRVLASRPVITSMVVIMGRAFKGVLVKGTMAIHATIIMLNAAGYEEAILRTLDVISSLTKSPNIKTPRRANDISRPKVKV